MPKRRRNKFNLDLAKISIWIINCIGIITLAFLFAFIFGDGIPNFFEFSLKENLLFLCFFIIIGGIISSFWKKLTGGIILITGSISFWLINFILTGNAWLGFYFCFFPILGASYIYIWFKTKKK